MRFNYIGNNIFVCGISPCHQASIYRTRSRLFSSLQSSQVKYYKDNDEEEEPVSIRGTRKTRSQGLGFFVFHILINDSVQWWSHFATSLPGMRSDKLNHNNRNKTTSRGDVELDGKEYIRSESVLFVFLSPSNLKWAGLISRGNSLCYKVAQWL